MNTIDDSKPIVPRGFNYDTLSRYMSRGVCSPLISYAVIDVLTRRLDRSGRDVREKVAAAAALWAAARFVLPIIRWLPRKVLGLDRPSVRWADEIIVVTGGSHGVGLELVKRLLRAGARVAILDVNEFPVTDEAAGGQWRYYRCDITDLEQVKATAAAVRGDLGDPTMLVNNAGIVVGKLLLEMTDGEVNKVIDVNLTAHFHLLRQFLPAMLRARRGHIVTIGSIVSFVGTPQASTYCASKGGVKLLHESLRREVATRYPANDIQFTIAYPGVIDSGLFRGLNLGRFFLPNLRPDSLARTVFAALGSGKGQEIFLPKITNLIPLVYAFSPRVRTSLSNLLGGGDSAMATFTGHTKY
ncbi:hypothetical protein IW140_004921 [Coemansia sp. RSA 1813]|nr:hypothetical protein EV178_005214 [Coemansia sp. RSA 1646]KAJ1771918.1 hypothetical protein LPJ74_001952 [Coemansia sp. RSA 1843]KAJ2087381.1 hypothetical protein IW138_004998 [Coemansia sp. RSA 986]KAJ2212252.1 hypothetical protein EV179_004803 [Coemansia sp. RSA 487]KAJ2566452.1 hypothetical protein IW140_004921 [Coemansia sp. RSA 1813]